MLEALRPKASTNLKELTDRAKSNDLRCLYPSALNEPILISLARDLREVERLFTEDGVSGTPLTPPLYLVCQLLLRPGTKNHARGELDISESGVARAMRVLQAAIEREIVTRIVGIGSLMNDEDFLAELDASLLQDVG